jgi:hypothetical protein
MGTDFPDGCTHIDKYIDRAERFHRLPLKSRIVVVMCRNWNDFERYALHFRGPEPGAVTFLTGTVIYVTPKLAGKKLDIGEYIRHEISHAALNQNQGLLEAFRIMRQRWFCEGLAVSFAEQKSYISPAEFFVARFDARSCFRYVSVILTAGPWSVRSQAIVGTIARG